MTVQGRKMTVRANFVRERLFCVILGLLADSKGEERKNENKNCML